MVQSAHFQSLFFKLLPVFSFIASGVPAGGSTRAMKKKKILKGKSAQSQELRVLKTPLVVMFSDHLFWCLPPCAPCGETPQYFRSEPTDSTERRPGQVGPVVSQAAAFLTAGHWANTGFWYCQKPCPASPVHVPEGAAGSGGSISPICFVVTLDSSLPSLKKLNPD